MLKALGATLSVCGTGLLLVVALFAGPLAVLYIIFGG
jgi:hypothetical protein